MLKIQNVGSELNALTQPCDCHPHQATASAPSPVMVGMSVSPRLRPQGHGHRAKRGDLQAVVLSEGLHGVIRSDRVFGVKLP